MKLIRILALLTTVATTSGTYAEISGSGHQVEGCYGEIRSLFWSDANENGIQDVGEPTLAGVAVGLSLREDPQQGEDTLHTDETGSVHFFNLCLKSYSLRIDEQSLPEGMSPTAASVGSGQDNALDSDGAPDLEPVRIDLTESHAVEETVDFGFNRDHCDNSIGDFVWLDADGNGVQDIDEGGIAGVDLSLTDEHGSLVATARTGPDGRYLFGNVCGGVHTINVEVGSASVLDLVAAPAAQGPDTAADSDMPNGGGALVYYVASGDDLAVDFGFSSPSCAGQLSGEVFLDADSNGSKDPGEFGIAGVGLFGVSEGDPGSNPHVSVTDSSGQYRFDGLCEGTYQVSVDTTTLLPETEPTFDGTTMSAINLPSNSAQVLIGAAGFSATCNGEIGDQIWLDANANGMQDPAEPGISNVWLALRDARGNIVGKAVSGDNGRYQFRGLCAGSFAVQVNSMSLPQHLSPTLSNQTGPHLDSDGPDPIWVSLVSGSSVDTSIDFGFTTDQCVLGLEAGCIVMTTVERWDHCHDPKELTMIWDGFEPIRVVAHEGSADDDVTADIDGVAPGDYLTVSVAGAPDDVIWEIFKAGTSEKLGESSFDLSCSDSAMDGPEDCGQRQGDGKNGDLCDGACINDWLLDGVVDKHGVENSLSCTANEAPAAGDCTVVESGQVSYRYKVTNLGPDAVDGVVAHDTQFGELIGSPLLSLPSGAGRTFVANADLSASVSNIVATAGGDAPYSCEVARAVDVLVIPPPPCLVVGGDSLDLSHDAFKWKLTNAGTDPVTVESVTLTWPLENEELKEIKIAGNKIFDQLRPPNTVVVGASELEPDESKRRIDPGKEEDFEVKFETHHHGNQLESDYRITVDFAESCSVSIN